MIVAENTWNDLSEYRNSLEHYGRKGMKWYEHIYGERQSHAKYAKGDSDSGKSKSTAKSEKADAKAKKKAEAKAAKERTRAEKEAAKKEAERREILSDPKKLYKHRKEFTYNEIRSAIDTFRWERELKGYSESLIKKGADFTNDLAKFTENSIKVYNQAARVVNSLYSENGKNVIPFIIDNKSGKKKDKKKDDD